MITKKNSHFLMRFDHHLEEEHVDQIVKVGSVDAKESLLRSPKLKEEHANSLVKDRSTKIRLHLTRYHQDKLNDSNIEKLVNDKDPYVRSSISIHPKLKEHQIDKLIGDPHYGVARALSLRGDLDVRHIDKLIDKPNTDLMALTWMAKRSDLKQHHIEKLENIGEYMVDSSLRKNPLYQDYLARKEQK